MPDFRFRCEIVDAETDEVIVQDHCTITDASIDEFGGCEMVDHAVAKMMRYWRASAKTIGEG